MQNNTDELTWDDVLAFFAEYKKNLLNYYRFPILLFVLFLALLATAYLSIPPVYTAEAIIGPPNPSPIKAMVASMGSGGAIGGLSRLAGGAASGSNDPFEEYQQLLSSSAISIALANSDRFMQRIFYKRWDDRLERWKENDSALAHFIGQTQVGLNHFFRRPEHITPDISDLRKYLDRHLKISRVQSSASTLSAFGSSGAGYISVSFPAETPDHAERYLTAILNRADNIIRQEQLRDVDARISYINEKLPTLTDVAQKNSLMNTLASQQELQIMMVADKRFAYVLVSAPYASPEPTFPYSPVISIFAAFGLSIFIWLGTILVEPRLAFLQRILKRLRSTPRAGDFQAPTN
jgi:LPS O-antigen subunit length determinant protein (WzzB/FepE family)